MKYIDLKQDLINELNDFKKDLEDIEEYGIKKVISNKELLDKELELSKRIDKILDSLETIEFRDLDTDIYNSILYLDIMLTDKFDRQLFFFNEELLKVFISNIKEVYFKTELTLDEIFDEFKLSINLYSDISKLQFEIYGVKSRLEETNELIKNITKENNLDKSNTKTNIEGGIENDRKLYFR